MRLLLLALLLASAPRDVPAQIPDAGRFEYVLYDNGDHPVGKYHFTIERLGAAWQVESEMTVDTSIMLLPIRLKDQNRFVHDGRSFRSFRVVYFKDVPLRSIVRQEVSGVKSDGGWSIQSKRNGTSSTRQLPGDSFSEVRNLISRLVRPEAVLRPGQTRRTLSLDPLSLEITEVESRGVDIESVDFQGRKRELFVMVTKASDGNVTVKKFASGLIYLSRTDEGYALLKSALAPSF